MKVPILIVLLPCLIRAEIGQNLYVSGDDKTNHDADDYQSAPESLSIIVKSWLQTDESIRRLSEKFVQSTLPYVFTLFTNAELTPDCSRDMVDFLRGIAETKLWAFQMFDAWGILPTGITKGTVSSLGDYNLCLNVSANNLFIGKYCSVDIEIPLPMQSDFRRWKVDVEKVFEIGNNDTIFNEFLSWGERLYMIHPRTAICIPSTCTDEDAHNLAKSAMELAGLQFNTNAKCETRQDILEVTFFDLCLMMMLLSLFLVFIAATTVDFYQRVTSDISYREEKGYSLLLHFSLFISVERLNKKDNNPDSIRVFYGIRVITMIWLIFAHVTFIDHLVAFGGLKEYFTLCQQSVLAQLSSGGILGVETFFFMSATLLSYHIVKNAEENISIGCTFVKRYLRTTIPHGLMIVVTWLLPFLSSGPLYNEIIGKEAQNCKERGWTNLLYINNFLPFSQICMGNTWYLAVDTQLFLLGILVIIPLRKNPRAAIVCLVALLFSGEIGILISHLMYDLPPTVLSIDTKMEYFDDLFQKSYFLPHFHLPTYSIGLIVGYCLALGKSARVSMKVSIVLWTASLVTMFSILFGTYFWNKNTDFPGLLPSVLFGCTHRVLWSLSLAWITMACQSSHGGIIGRFLGSEKFVLLNRLTFMAYLTNFTIKYLYLGTTKNIIIYNQIAIVNLFMSITIATFVASFALTLLFEAPFMSLEKLLINKMSEMKKTGKGK